MKKATASATAPSHAAATLPTTLRDRPAPRSTPPFIASPHRPFFAHWHPAHFSYLLPNTRSLSFVLLPTHRFKRGECAGLAVPTGQLEPTGSGHVLEDRDTILGHEPKNKETICASLA
jgi:hypothetical protein